MIWKKLMLNTIIIGAGMMAGGYDAPESEYVLTHAHAYKKHPDFNLLGFYDIDYDKAKEMALKWNCQAFDSKNNLPYADVISICTPDVNHVADCFEYSKLDPRLIFLEKPLAHTKHEAEILKNLNIPILVNYSRRFSKEFQMIHEQISCGVYGKYLSGSGYYGKGTIHNGSHMIDLINWLISPVKSYQVTSETKDFYDNDTTKSMILTLSNDTRFYMHGVDCNCYTIFELDFLFEKGRIKIINSGQNIHTFKVIEDTVYSAFKKLSPSQTYETDITHSLYNSLDNISNFIYKNERLLCTINDGQQAILYE